MTVPEHTHRAQDCLACSYDAGAAAERDNWHELAGREYRRGLTDGAAAQLERDIKLANLKGAFCVDIHGCVAPFTDLLAGVRGRAVPATEPSRPPDISA